MRPEDVLKEVLKDLDSRIFFPSYDDRFIEGSYVGHKIASANHKRCAREALSRRQRVK